MCGIAGWIALRNTPLPAHRVLAMTERLRHRGPDDGGIVFFSKDEREAFIGEAALERATAPNAIVALSNRRLAIIDPKGGAQPVSDSSGRHFVVLNGEIYNHRRLRQELEASGVKFRSDSDTEVVVAAFARWGAAALDRFVGMFAIAWWDTEAERLLIARDRLGIKPLYYATVGSDLAFASEIRSLVLMPGVNQDIDVDALRDFLLYRYIPSPRTMHRGIRALPPGHVLVLDRRAAAPSIEPQRWWKLDISVERDLTLDRAVNELDALLDDVCRDHLVSDVPVGVFLTGGVDSSTILAHSAKYSDGALRAVTVGFRGREHTPYNEIDAAADTARRFGVPFVPITLDSQVMSLLPQAVDALDEPMGDPSALPALAMMREARGVAKVMLSGDGGDEVFGGYDRYQKPTDRERSAAFRHSIYAMARAVGEWSGLRARRSERRMLVTTPEEVDRLILPEFQSRSRIVPLRDRVEIASGRDPLTQWQQIDLQTYLVDDNLKKTDRTSMAFGVEVRVPLVDSRIVEFGLTLAASLRRDASRGKVVLREALARHLPVATTQRPKNGFKVPLAKWFRKEERSPYLDALFEPDRPIWKLLDREFARGWLLEHRARVNSHAQKLYNLLVLDEWLRTRTTC